MTLPWTRGGIQMFMRIYPGLRAFSPVPRFDLLIQEQWTQEIPIWTDF